MKRASFGAGFGMVCLLAAPGWAQSPQADELRQQIKALEEQLESLESADKGNRRVTQIGGPRSQAFDPRMQNRLYDLSDLFAVVPAYEARYSSDLAEDDRSLFPSVSGVPVSGATGAMGGMGGGGGFFRTEDRPRELPDGSRQVLSQAQPAESGGNLAAARVSVDNLIEAITSNIVPDMWDDAGGPYSIATIGNAMMVSADAATHDQIEALLNLFRQRWGTLRTISVRAYWLWLNDAEMAALLTEDGEDQPPADDIQAFGLVAKPAWDDLMGQLQQGANEERAGYRAMVTCYNGQTVHTVSGGQTLAVTQIEPLVDEVDDEAGQAGVAYRPVVSVIQEGAALQITPIANTSGKFVVLDIHSRVGKLREPAQPAQPAAERRVRDHAPAPQDVVAAIDRPLLVTHRLSTTLRVPVDRAMLVGGMTFESQPAPGEPSLYLFVKVSVQELRDDLDQPEPVAEPNAAPDEEPAAAATPSG